MYIWSISSRAFKRVLGCEIWLGFFSKKRTERTCWLACLFRYSRERSLYRRKTREKSRKSMKIMNLSSKVRSCTVISSFSSLQMMFFNVIHCFSLVFRWKFAREGFRQIPCQRSQKSFPKNPSLVGIFVLTPEREGESDNKQTYIWDK